MTTQTKIEFSGFTATISQDPDYPDPMRETDAPDVFATWHRRYAFGDDASARWSREEYRKANIGQHDLVLDVYMYDHSGVVFSHSPFADKWDSGWLGWHWISQEAIIRDFTGDVELAKKWLKARLEVFNNYVSGDVWEVVTTDPRGEEVDSYSLAEAIDDERCARILADLRVLAGNWKYQDFVKPMSANEILTSLVESFGEAFDADEPINGSDAVEWICDTLPQARVWLAKQSAVIADLNPL